MFVIRKYNSNQRKTEEETVNEETVNEETVLPTLEEMVKEIYTPDTTTLDAAKERLVEVEVTVNDFKAELATLESSEERDTIVIRAKKADIRATEVTFRNISKEVARLNRAIKRDLIRAQKTARRELNKMQREQLRAKNRREKEENKARRIAERKANRMPKQNDIRRPKPLTLCGRAWAIMDKVTADLEQPAPISVVLELAREQNLNEGNVRAEYARWRKFNNITGRITVPKPEPDEDEEGDIEDADEEGDIEAVA